MHTIYELFYNKTWDGYLHFINRYIFLIAMNRLLTNEEAAERLNISPNTLNVLRSNGKGPCYVQVAGSIRYSEDALQKYVLQHSINPESRKNEKR